MNFPRQPAAAELSSTSKELGHAQFASEFQQCYGRLWTLAAAILGDRHLAEDVVQDAGIVALKQLGKFEPGTNLLAWLSQIVRLQSLNYSRKRTRRRTQSVDPIILDAQTDAAEMASPLPNSTKTLSPEQTIFDDEVLHALNDLGDVARACLLLRTLHQLSYTEIGTMLDIAEGTAMSHVHRSKALLRKRLASKAKGFDKTTK